MGPPASLVTSLEGRIKDQRQGVLVEEYGLIGMGKSMKNEDIFISC